MENLIVKIFSSLMSIPWDRIERHKEYITGLIVFGMSMSLFFL